MSKMSKETARAIEVWTAAKGTPDIIREWEWNGVMREHHMNTSLRTAAKYMGYTKHEVWAEGDDTCCILHAHGMDYYTKD